MAAGTPRRRRAVRRLHVRARDRLRARPPLLHRRRAAECPPPPASGRAVRGLGDPQRRPRAGAQSPGRDLRRNAGRNRHRRQRRPRRHRHRTHLHRNAAARTPAEFLAHLRAGDVLARGAQGSAAKWAHAAIALAARSLGRGVCAGASARSRPAARDGDGAPPAARGRRAPGTHGGGELTPADARCLLHAWLARSSSTPRRARPDRLHAGRGLQPRRPLPARLPSARAQAARRRRVAAVAAAARTATSHGRRGAL